MKTIFLWITGLAILAAMPSQGQSKLYIYQVENKIDSFALANITKLVFSDNLMQAQLKTGDLESYAKSEVNVMSFHYPITQEDVSSESPYPLLDFAVYPNPTTGKLFIYAGRVAENAQICIYDIHGVLIKQYVMKSPNIDISDFSSGIYYLQVIDKNGMAAKKIIKN